MNKKEKLNKIIECGESLIDNKKGKNSPEFIAWNSSLIRFMENEFGVNSSDTKRFKNRYYYPSILAIGADNSDTIYKKYKSDLETTVLELKSIYEEYDDICNSNDNIFEEKHSTIVPNITLNVDNSNYNSNVNNISITFDLLIKDIQENKEINDEEKKEILETLKEIETIQNNNISKKEKWGKTKVLLSFLLDKGMDFVITYLPQIIILIKNVGGI